MTTELHYAGFWRRFGALWLDFLFFLPLTGFVFWMNERFRLFQAVYVIPGCIIGIVYGVYLVKRFGGTPGKVIAGLRISKLDGSPIGYKEAIVRALPEFSLGLLMSIGLALATLKMSDSDYASLGYMDRNRQLMTLTPAWFTPVQILQTIWVWSEFIVLLTNKKRRALHDFIAGTVVVLRKPAPSPLPPTLPLAEPTGAEG